MTWKTHPCWVFGSFIAVGIVFISIEAVKELEQVGDQIITNS
ncbi:hypothetical protein COO91_09520 (plasmid) [Nostoc flagelliforme CCNUN1]|uniref:Uncharacterized protein n=1 Tax=Nostoc flagelliforme CCNUN1 TaxID=2038116 RepID=A0A2K8T8D9_9NOSO|nr:hypothetical protein COO91_09520 [Nostoc flagelliforme CCNUN1]